MSSPGAQPRARARTLHVVEAGIFGRAQRVLAVLAVTLGVLAMHGLAGGHHGAVPTLPSVTAAAAVLEQHAAGAAHAAGHAGHRALDAGASVAAAAPLPGLADRCDGDCSEHPSGLLLLCAAVLLAAAGLLALRLARRTWRTLPTTGPPQLWGPRATAPLRRLDPVADLCISRT